MSLNAAGHKKEMRAGAHVIMPMSPESLGSLGGLYSPSQSTAYSLASRCIFIPFTIGELVTAYQMFTHNGTAIANNIDVGIYTSKMVSMVTMGSTAQAGASDLQLFNITDTLLVPGNYFMGLSMDGAPPTGTFSRWSIPTGRSLRLMGCLEKLATFPLPTGAVATTAVTDGYVPHFGVVLGGAGAI